MEGIRRRSHTRLCGAISGFVVTEVVIVSVGKWRLDYVSKLWFSPSHS